MSTGVTTGDGPSHNKVDPSGRSIAEANCPFKNVVTSPRTRGGAPHVENNIRFVLKQLGH
jgi:hypothetical protein